MGSFGRWVSESTAGWSSSAKAYQEFVTGMKAGQAYEVGGYRFDGFKNGVLLEAKSSYDNFVSGVTGEFKSWFSGSDALLTQAQNQLKSANGTPIEWHFKTQKSLNATQKLFNDNGIQGITLKHVPEI